MTVTLPIHDREPRLLPPPLLGHCPTRIFRITRLKIGLPLLALSLSACGPSSDRAPDLVVDQPWARATVAGNAATAAYLTITNRRTLDDALVEVTSSSGSASIHSTASDGGIARMRKVERLALPAGTTVRLEPGGTHVMLDRPSEPLAPGGKIELGLRFEKSPARKVNAEIRDWPGE